MQPVSAFTDRHMPPTPGIQARRTSGRSKISIESRTAWGKERASSEPSGAAHPPVSSVRRAMRVSTSSGNAEPKIGYPKRSADLFEYKVAKTAPRRISSSDDLPDHPGNLYAEFTLFANRTVDRGQNCRIGALINGHVYSLSILFQAWSWNQNTHRGE
jgi:hypothetical protein